jgi:hypothetical protein
MGNQLPAIPSSGGTPAGKALFPWQSTAGNQTKAQLNKTIFRNNAVFIFFTDFRLGTQIEE